MKILLALCLCVGFANAQDIVYSECNFDEDLQAAARKKTATEPQKKAAAKDRDSYMACITAEYDKDSECNVDEGLQAVARKKNATDSDKDAALDNRMRYVVCSKVKSKADIEHIRESLKDPNVQLALYCEDLYNRTINKKVSELTVRQNMDIARCQTLKLYHGNPSLDSLIRDLAVP